MDVDKLLYLQRIFNQQFKASMNTVFEFGAEEPFYQAEQQGQSAIIFSRDSFFSSALHEISHWCLAGESRRQQDDYGYWYEPDGRNEAQQRVFERVEIKPQALEWFLSLATDHSFHFSADNLNPEVTLSETFKREVRLQLIEFLSFRLPKRAEQLARAFVLQFKRPTQSLELHTQQWLLDLEKECV